MKRWILVTGLMIATPAFADVVDDSPADSPADTDAADGGDDDSKGCNTAGMSGAMGVLAGLSLLAGLRARRQSAG